MILYSALSIDSTKSPITGIDALIIFTSQRQSTVSMYFTFSSTSRERISKVITFTFTKTSVARRDFSNGVASTRVRNTRIPWNLGFLGTQAKWISDVSSQTFADHIVILNKTLGVLTTNTHTRIGTLVLPAIQSTWTVCIDGTFRSAVRWRTKVTRQAPTVSITILISARSITTTGIWIARIDFFYNRFRYSITANESVWGSLVTWQA